MRLGPSAGHFFSSPVSREMSVRSAPRHPGQSPAEPTEQTSQPIINGTDNRVICVTFESLSHVPNVTPGNLPGVAHTDNRGTEASVLAFAIGGTPRPEPPSPASYDVSDPQDNSRAGGEHASGLSRVVPMASVSRSIHSSTPLVSAASRPRSCLPLVCTFVQKTANRGGSSLNTTAFSQEVVAVYLSPWRGLASERDMPRRARRRPTR